MRYINTLHEGETIRNVYLCKGKRSAETRNGRPYDNLILQDKTGTLDGKVWDPNSGGIADYDEMDFIEVYGEIISYNNNLQLNIKQIRKAQEGEYIAADYMPTTEKSTDGMYEELLGYIKKVENQYLRQVLEYYFVKDETFIRNFKGHSAAKTVHHGFAGGLLEHTLSVVKFCDYMVGAYPILNKDLLFTAAICHDIGKTKIPEEILNAPRRLTEEEFEIIKAHPVYSYELLWDNVDEDIRLAARHHHERLDGKGYPDQIAGDEISLLARITAISDVYDAMISQRSYKESMIPFDVLEKFKKGEFPGLDERLVDLFVKNMVENYRDVKVQMSDGRIGVVRYIPPNDLNHPIINCNHDVSQTDDKWYCVCIANQTGK